MTADRRRKVVEAHAVVNEEQFILNPDQLYELLSKEPLFVAGVLELIGIKCGQSTFVSEPAALEAQAAAEAARAATPADSETPKRTPKSLRQVALQARIRKSPQPSANAESNVKEKADAWAASRQVESDLLTLLEDFGLDGLARGAGMAGILKMRVFKMYTIEELEESFKRSTVLGSKFKFSKFERKQLVMISASRWETRHPLKLSTSCCPRPSPSCPSSRMALPRTRMRSLLQV